MTKLLLVEDDNNLREIYEARLQAEGYTIVSAHDGEEALVVAKAEKPDLIISDVMMPKISGFEMLDILRNTDGLKDVKVIMLTALGQSDDQQRADRLGADRYLVKSQVTLEDIVKVAHDLLGDTGNAMAEPEVAPVKVDNPQPATTESGAPAQTSDLSPTSVDEPAAAPSEPVSSAPDLASPPTAEPQATDSVVSTADTSTAPASATPPAESTASEEAAVEAQIEDFVAGAAETSATPSTAAADTPAIAADNDLTSATPPAPEPAQEPVADSSGGDDAADTTPVDPAATQAADQKLVSDAADALEENTKTADDETAKDTADEADDHEDKKTGGERVIQPIESEPKKDLDALLAAEEAKDSAAQAAAAKTIPVIVDDKAGAQTPAAPAPNENKVDPNNIAI